MRPMKGNPKSEIRNPKEGRRPKSAHFKKSIGTCRKESKEAMLFLRLIATAEENLAPEARKLWREAKELNLIFGSIWRK